MRSLIDSSVRVSVSSSQDKASGRRNLVDGNPDTCWCSGTPKEAVPAYVSLAFEAPVVPQKLLLTFQGGFVGRTTSVFAQRDAQDWQLVTRVFPEDVNRQQAFELPADTGAVRALKLVFQDGSDFFGRITLYDLQLHGIDAS